MKYELETIPVWDAFKSEGECPMCILHKKSEESYLKFFLGNSVMVPEMRVEVNKTGFCPEHFSKLLQKRSPHYLGLMTHTHFKEYRKLIEKKFLALESVAKTAVGKVKIPLKNRKLIDECNTLKIYIDKNTSKCMICDRLANAMKRYSFTIVYLWKKDDDFKDFFNKSKGFCLLHTGLLTQMAGEILNGVELGKFVQELIEIERNNLIRLEDEVLYFTQKFSQENADKPWNGTKDAHYRAIQKITGMETEH